MTANFTPRLDILPPSQRRLWDELSAVPVEFVLYGGTAIALHLGHRESVDFDFFGAGMKASVVQMRAEAKDYIDIDALLTDGRIDLPMALAAGRAIYGTEFNPQSALKALTYFDDGNLRQLPDSVKDRLAKAVREVDLDCLPVIAASSLGLKHDRGLSR